MSIKGQTYTVMGTFVMHDKVNGGFKLDKLVSHDVDHQRMLVLMEFMKRAQNCVSGSVFNTIEVTNPKTGKLEKASNELMRGERTAMTVGNAIHMFDDWEVKYLEMKPIPSLQSVSRETLEEVVRSDSEQMRTKLEKVNHVTATYLDGSGRPVTILNETIHPDPSNDRQVDGFTFG